MGLVLVATNLRPAIASVPPFADQISADLHLSAAQMGLLTTLPVVCMGLFAPVGALASRRVGMERTVLGAMALLGAGTLLRGFGGTAGLYAGTITAGTGIAVAGALLPSLVRGRFPGRAGPVTGLYTAGLIGGAMVAAAATVPVANALGARWPAALQLWTVPALVALLGWLPMTGAHTVPTATVPTATVPTATVPTAGAASHAGTPHASAPHASAPYAGTPHASAPHASAPWRSTGAWLATLFMGGQSLLYYASLAWLAPRYTSLGADPTRAGLLLGMFSFTQLFSALGLPLLAHRFGRIEVWIGASLATTTGSLLAIAVAPSAAPWLWAALLGLGMGGQFALALTVLAGLGATPAETAAASGMAFFVGYLLASAGPVLAGAVYDLTGELRTPFLMLAGLGLATLVAGAAAGRDARVGPLPSGATLDGGST
jgi:MFS transporter, CP family, cyanate transporter